MLIEFYGQNFGCFRDEFRLSMLATDIDPDSERGVIEVKVDGDDEPLRLLRAIAIYGPNASGKSTVLRAAGALKHLISESALFPSDFPLIPYEPFGLTENGSPVRLGIKAVIDGGVYDYEIQFVQSHFTSERLIWIHPDGRDDVLLNRQGQDVSGQWTNEPQFALISQNFRPNALLLSLADRLAPALVKNLVVGIQGLLVVDDDPYTSFEMRKRDDVAKRAWSDRAFADWLTFRLKSADIGVIDMQPEEVEENISLSLRERKAMRRNEMTKRKAYRLRLKHGAIDSNFTVPYRFESLGTRKIVDLAPMLYDLVHSQQPIAVFVDELHESLHPLLLQEILRDFNCETRPSEVHGQLIFATHETSLLDAEAKNAVLRRDQIYLTEKDASGAARLYSVAEFSERNNLNIRKRYLQGRYGALPALGKFAH